MIIRVSRSISVLVLVLILIMIMIMIVIVIRKAGEAINMYLLPLDGPSTGRDDDDDNNNNKESKSSFHRHHPFRAADRDINSSNGIDAPILRAPVWEKKSRAPRWLTTIWLSMTCHASFRYATRSSPLSSLPLSLITIPSLCWLSALAVAPLFVL